MCYGTIYSAIWCYMFCDMMLYILCDIVLYVLGYGVICSVICLSCGVLSFGNRYIVVLMLLYIIVFLITITDWICIIIVDCVVSL